MKIGVYKIQFNKSSYELNSQYDGISQSEKDKLSESNVIGSYDMDDIDFKYVLYVITCKIEINKYIEILNNNFIQYKIYDITNDVLMNRINWSEILLDKKKEYYTFINDINLWISENLDIDIVLDRISESGIESLTTIEKEFLKTYKV